MRYLLLLLACAASLLGQNGNVQLLLPATGSTSGSWVYRTLTIDHTQAGTATTATAPILVHSPNGIVSTSGTTVSYTSGDTFPAWMSSTPIRINGVNYTISSRTNSTTLILTSSAGTQSGVAYSGTPWLATQANGGSITHTVTQSGGNSMTIPADLIFATGTNCGTKVAGWEFKSYDATTGVANIYVNWGTVSNASDTIVYECYGKASVVTQQMTTTSTWDANFIAVYLNGETSGTSIKDSTTTAAHLTKVSSAKPSPVTANLPNQSGSGDSFNGVDARASVTSATIAAVAAPFTEEVWVNFAAVGSIEDLFHIGDLGSAPFIKADLGLTAANKADFAIGTTSTDYHATGATTLTTSTGYYIVGIWPGSTTSTIYLNGVSDGTNTGVGGTSVAPSNAVDMGLSSVFTTEPTNGVLSDIRWSNVSRSTSYLTLMYNNMKLNSTLLSVGAETPGT